jgi:uncharacterized membrane protein SpoIIM required for sporulation
VRRPGAEIQATISLYLQVSTHLTQARDRYSDPALERYLNDLVGRARQTIYGARPTTIRGSLAFFGARYRHEIRRSTGFILIASALLVVGVLASWLWVAYSPEAQVGLFPPQARAAIERMGEGRPDLGPSGALATTILFNNVRVAFLAFALGITLGIGTVFVLLQNAVIIGVLAGAFGAAGHAASFWALVLPHGILELIAIGIAAAAGMRMGWAIVDPGDRARSRALSEEAAGAMVVVLGVVPAFVLAAVIEGFVTGAVFPPVAQVGLGGVVAISYVVFLFGRGPWFRRAATPVVPHSEPAG